MDLTTNQTLRQALDDLNDLSRNLIPPSKFDNRYYKKPEDVPLDVIREKINSATSNIYHVMRAVNVTKSAEKQELPPEKQTLSIEFKRYLREVFRLLEVKGNSKEASKLLEIADYFESDYSKEMNPATVGGTRNVASPARVLYLSQDEVEVLRYFADAFRDEVLSVRLFRELIFEKQTRANAATNLLKYIEGGEWEIVGNEFRQVKR